MPVINVDETKYILNAINQKYAYDFSNYALTSLRYTLDKLIKNLHIENTGILVNRLREDSSFFDEFLYLISVPGHELFREAEMWKLLKNSVIPQLIKYPEKPVIWFPDAVEGKELYSFLILAHYENLGENLKIVVSSLSQKSISLISNGYFNPGSMNLGIENFKKLYPGMDINLFLKKRGCKFFFDSPYLGKINYYKQNLENQPMPGNSTIIFFRNKLLNYTLKYQNLILLNLINNVKPGGYLITGNKENINDYLMKENNLRFFNHEEKIYLKI